MQCRCSAYTTKQTASMTNQWKKKCGPLFCYFYWASFEPFIGCKNLLRSACNNHIDKSHVTPHFFHIKYSESFLVHGLKTSWCWLYCIGRTARHRRGAADYASLLLSILYTYIYLQNMDCIWPARRNKNRFAVCCGIL